MLCEVGEALKFAGMRVAEDAYQIHASDYRFATNGADEIYRRENGLLHGAKKLGQQMRQRNAQQPNQSTQYMGYHTNQQKSITHK